MSGNGGGPTDALGFTTVHTEALVRVLARTNQATARLLEFLDIFRGDPRIQALFVVDPGSRYGDGVTDLLHAAGAKIVTAAEAARLKIALTLSASENVDHRSISGPVVIVPHGIGFHKFLRDTADGTPRLAGVVPPEAAATGHVHTLVFAEDQAAQVRPYAAGTVTVVGDPFFERIAASRRFRLNYRRHFGIDDDRRLVVVASTWGDQSLYGRWQDLPARLLRELPADEFAVAVVLHPNIWFGHSPWQTRAWLADARDAGLIVVRPVYGWQAALIAADMVIGDHGSVCLYAAAGGTPVLIARPGDELVPGTAMARLLTVAPALRWERGLGPQVRTAQDTTRAAAVARDALGEVDGANQRVRDLIYRLIRLRPPANEAAVRAFGLPNTEREPACSFAVYTADHDAGVRLWRVPAAVDDPVSTPIGSGADHRHLACFHDEVDVGRWQSAAVVAQRHPMSRDAAATWIDAQAPPRRITAAPLTGSPGAVLAAVRDQGWWLVYPNGDADPIVVTSALYHLAATGRLDTGPITVLVGARTHRLDITAAR